MEMIPYTVEVREDTGLNNAKLGIWLFLASEVMLFGGLFMCGLFAFIYVMILKVLSNPKLKQAIKQASTGTT